MAIFDVRHSSSSGETIWKNPENKEQSGTITVPRHGNNPVVSRGVVRQVREQLNAETKESNEIPLTPSTAPESKQTRRRAVQR